MALALAVSPLLLCSCSEFSHKYNYGFPGDPRPAEEAILTGHVEINPKLNVVLDDPEISKVDGHSCLIMAPGSVRGSIGESFEVRLLPGIHKIQVEPAGFQYSPRWANQSRGITFEAVAGRHYELRVAILDRKMNFNFIGPNIIIKWTAKIVEVETGKEFLLEVPSSEAVQ